MKKAAVVVAISLFAVLIVLPVMRPVNDFVGNPVLQNGTLNADGVPAPAPWPPRKSMVNAGTQVADGVPAPPPWPPSKGGQYSLSV